jgi:hypothetical protein
MARKRIWYEFPAAKEEAERFARERNIKLIALVREDTGEVYVRKGRRWFNMGRDADIPEYDYYTTSLSVPWVAYFRKKWKRVRENL